jgi:chromosome segregation ATPase
MVSTPLTPPNPPIDLHIFNLVDAVNQLIQAINQLIAYIGNLQQQNTALTAQVENLQKQLLDETAHDTDLQKQIDADNAQIAALQASGSVDVNAVKSSIDASVTQLQGALGSIQKQLPNAVITPVAPVATSQLNS